ncbi:MAG: 16S rRNA (adenine(1518)-N(6)/adenine(1519)-N(6))-dimethyltransferase RsmA [Rhodospirillaceae bacterium]|nr:16S rRNA (adenine(1518)-N(6)/adenine(1519)-N(6))-dimethyltransferase RsmA [Rhodospirillaceae bacterium]
MIRLADLPPLREVICRHGLSARKELGQHFLLDANLTDRIAHAARRRHEADLSAGTVIEVGPGPGGMTRSLLRLNARVLALEVDPRALGALTELQTAAPERLVIVEVDALTADIQTLAAKHGLPPPYRIVSNLPYNIGTLLLLQWLRRLDKLEHLVLMFQKEVADRLVSTPGSKSYGRLSILTQWLCVTERLFNVHAASFTPPPKVASSVVSLRPRRTPLAPARMETLERITAAAFGQRRKMLRQSLKSIMPNPSTLLTAANIDPMSRAEVLSVADFCAIARQVNGKADGS